jgi:hypothetical protein
VGVNPTGRLIAYREYKAGDRSAAQELRTLRGHTIGVTSVAFAAAGVQRRCGDFAVQPAGAFRCQTIRRR